MSRFFWVLVLGIVGLALVSCSDTENASVKVAQPRLLQTPDGNRAFSGILINNREKPIRIAHVKVALYDEVGSPVETIRIDVTDVFPQDSASFNSTIDSDRSFRQAQVKEILTP